jgi:replicative DNA helicase
MLEQLIFGNLIFREDYGRKVIPFLSKELFQDHNDKALFDLVESYVHKYNRFPTKEALAIDLTNKAGLNDDQVKLIAKNIEDLSYDPKTELDWLVDKTEKFVQERSVYNAIMQSIQILDNKDQNKTKGSIPQILTDALSISFDTNIGHNFTEDSDARYAFYHRKELKIPFNLDYFNRITKGGIPRKTLNIILAGTGIGKSLAMCHFAAGNLLEGRNVLYITLEMAEERIAERIDANLMNVTMDELGEMDYDTYNKKLSRVKNITTGKLIIKEYPTASAGSANFRHLLNELKLKKNFTPDIIYIDYLNICASSRMKYGNNINSYMYIKAIAEELRGLAVEFNVPIFSATQTTRGGYCLSLDTIVFVNNKKLRIADVKIGDRIDTFGGQNIVKTVFPVTKKKAYKITLKNGQTVVCSKDHMFPTPSGEKSLKTGLKLGDCLLVKRKVL